LEHRVSLDFFFFKWLTASGLVSDEQLVAMARHTVANERAIIYCRVSGEGQKITRVCQNSRNARRVTALYATIKCSV
jgi:hypothetical protein